MTQRHIWGAGFKHEDWRGCPTVRERVRERDFKDRFTCLFVWIPREGDPEAREVIY